MKKKKLSLLTLRKILPFKSRIVAFGGLFLGVGLLFCLSAQIGIFQPATKTNGIVAPAPITPGNSLSVNPSKEYIYAGGRLLATEELTTSLPLVNLALNRTATQSTTFTDNGVSFSASRAVDGNTNGDLNGGGSTSATNYQSQPAWQVDLGGVKAIESIQLWSRTDCCPEMLRNFYVFVSDVPFTSAIDSPNLTATQNQAGVASYQTQGDGGRPTTISVNRTGRYVRVQMSGSQYLTLAEVQVWGTANTGGGTCSNTGINVASASRGATVSVSSTYSPGYSAGKAIDGSRKGTWGNGGGWNDATSRNFPDWIQVDLNAAKNIGEIDVFTLQDNYTNPVDPTESMTFSAYGNTSFEVQYWSGTSWAAVPGGIITGNNKVWRRIIFTPITTSKIRVLVNGSADGVYSRVAEIEAYESCGSGGQSTTLENVVWTSVVGATPSGNNLTKSSAPDGWNTAGAVSTKAVASGNGYVEFTVGETNTYRMCGLSYGNTDQNYNDIDFAIYAMANGYLQIWEGSLKKDLMVRYQVGDRLKVSVENGVVKYWQNDQLVWTSSATVRYPLLVDTALYTNGATLKNVVISGLLQ